MIRHIVIFRWREAVSEGEVAAVLEQLRALPQAIEALADYLAGPDLGLTAGTGDFAIVATVADAAALASYLEHPQHVAVATRLRAMAESRTAVQVAVD